MKNNISNQENRVFEKINELDYAEQEKDIMKLILIIQALMAGMDKEKRDTWCLILAGDLLYNVDKDLRELFFANYEDMRGSVETATRLFELYE